MRDVLYLCLGYAKDRAAAYAQTLKVSKGPLARLWFDLSGGEDVAHVRAPLLACGMGTLEVPRIRP